MSSYITIITDSLLFLICLYTIFNVLNDENTRCATPILKSVYVRATIVLIGLSSFIHLTFEALPKIHEALFFGIIPIEGWAIIQKSCFVVVIGFFAAYHKKRYAQ